MNPAEFRASLQRVNAQVPPVLFFIGGDEYLCRDLVQEAKRKVLGDAGSLSPAEFWDGEENSLADILTSADQLAFGGSRKLLVVKHAEPLLSQDEQWESYLKNPSPSSVLIFCLEKLDMRRKCATAIEELCTIVTTDEPYAGRQEGEVHRLLQRFPRMKFHPEALACLRDWVDDDLGALSKELEKISLAFPDKPLLEVADIEALVFRQETQNVFELVDAIVAGDRKKALEILIRATLDDGKSVLEIFGLLRSQAEKLYRAGEMLDAGGPARSVCQTLRIPQFFADAFVRKARKVKEISPSRFFSLLYQSDRAIKTGLMPEDLAAQMLVWNICSR